MLQNSFWKIKNISLYAIIFINLLCIPFYDTAAMAEEESMVDAFKSTNAKIEEININGYASKENRFTNPDEGKKICLALAEKLEIEEYSIEDFSSVGNTQINLIGKGKEGQRITIIAQATEYEEIKETNVVVDIVDEKIEDVEFLSEKVRESLESFGKVALTSCITGSFSGELKNVQKEEISENLMKKLNANEVEGIREGNMISITGYSSSIKDYIYSGGNKVNLNIALRYNAYEDKTFLWIGSPLIAIGY